MDPWTHISIIRSDQGVPPPHTHSKGGAKGPQGRGMAPLIMSGSADPLIVPFSHPNFTNRRKKGSQNKGQVPPVSGGSADPLLGASKPSFLHRLPACLPRGYNPRHPSKSVLKAVYLRVEREGAHGSLTWRFLHPYSTSTINRGVPPHSKYTKGATKLFF
jgi:hypothetical protein